MSLALELRKQRYEVVQEMHTVLESKRSDKMTRWNELNQKQKELLTTIETTEAQDALDRSMSSISNADRPSIGQRHLDERMTVLGVRGTAEYKHEFNTWLRTGHEGKHLSDLRTYTPLGSTGDADGNTLVPIGFQKELEVTMKAIGGVRQKARVLTTTTGNQLSWPTEDDTANEGEWLTENSPVDQQNPTFGTIPLNSFLASSKQVLVPVQLLQDSALDVEGLLVNAFGIRLARTTNKAYTLGDGSTIPITGLLTALVSAGGRSVLAVGANGNSGNSADTEVNSVGTDDFANLISKVDPAYRENPNACFMANMQIYDKLRQTKDKFGRPIWSVSLAVGEPDAILGYPYIYNQAMDTIAASAKSVVFGDFSKYVIRDVTGITVVRFNEVFMSNHQIGFQAFLRTEGKLLQSAAFSYLLHPLS